MPIPNSSDASPLAGARGVHDPAVGPPADPGLTLGFSPGTETNRWVDHYRLIRCLGQGGMGEVWLAEQVEPVRRRVALKWIRAGMDNADTVARFQSEAQALALMDHPAIARVYDVAASPGQRPYFAMEYVPGVPITGYCEENRLSLRQRLELFALVCEGVQHAHQKALIHRDLKPSNILVVELDGRAAPKIIDFGIAKAVGAPLIASTPYTVAGFLIGTPDYMSPEQALGDVDIDTRADIYSLGVVLYELLTGALPFRSKETTTPPDELIRRLREEDAPRPSTKVKESRAGQAADGARRRGELQVLARELRGDLDAIVLKALEKDRKRRYSSVSELAADVAAYLQNLPVSAAPPSTVYRLRKFVIRHRAVAGGVALALFFLLALAIVMTVETVRIARERDRADREAAAARQTSDFLVNLFRSANPVNSNGSGPTTARDLLDAGARQAASALGGAPVAEARLHNTMGEAYRMMGEESQAHTQFSRALALADEAEGKSSANSLAALEGSFQVERMLGHRSAAVSIAAEMSRRTAGLAPGSEPAARATRCQAEMLKDQGQFRQAESLLRASLNAIRTQQGDARLEAATLLSLSRALRSQSRFAEAAQLNRELAALQQRLSGPTSPPVLEALGALADNLESQGKTQEALAILYQLRQSQGRIFGPDNPQTLWTEYAIGVAQVDGGHPAEGVVTLREVARHTIAVRGPDTPFTFTVLIDLGSALYQAGRPEEAEPILRRVAGKLARTEGPEASNALWAQHELGTCLLKLKHFDEAGTILNHVYRIRVRKLGFEHAHTIDSMAVLGDLAAAREQWEEAERQYRRAIELMVKTGMSPAGITQYRERLAAVMAHRADAAAASHLDH